MKHRSHHLTATLNDFYHRPVAKVSLELFLSITLILILAVFAIQPTLVTISSLNNEIEEKRKLEEGLKRKIDALNSANSQYAAAQPRLGLLDEAIPSKPQLIESLKIIEKLATENNVIVMAANVSDIPPEEEYSPTFSEITQNTIAVSVTVRGDYISIKNYVQSLIDSRRSLVIDTVSFSVTENRQSKSLSATITINMPYFGVPK